jgi:hypothetical protein
MIVTTLIQQKMVELFIFRSQATGMDPEEWWRPATLMCCWAGGAFGTGPSGRVDEPWSGGYTGLRPAARSGLLWPRTYNMGLVGLESEVFWFWLRAVGAWRSVDFSFCVPSPGSNWNVSMDLPYIYRVYKLIKFIKKSENIYFFHPTSSVYKIST